MEDKTRKKHCNNKPQGPTPQKAASDQSVNCLLFIQKFYTHSQVVKWTCWRENYKEKWPKLIKFILNFLRKYILSRRGVRLNPTNPPLKLPYWRFKSILLALDLHPKIKTEKLPFDMSLIYLLYIFCLNALKHVQERRYNPASILYKSIAGRYRPVRVADGPITARYRFIKNASWESQYKVNKQRLPDPYTRFSTSWRF